jgi:uncharacterized membrane protein
MATDPSARLRRWAPTGLAVLFALSGTLHLVRPGLFQSLVPAALPQRDAIVAVSGLAELVCAAGLFGRAGWAGPASALLLIAVFPGNVKMAMDAVADPGASRLLVAATIVRLPLQLPLIWAALQAPRPGRRA